MAEAVSFEIIEWLKLAESNPDEAKKQWNQLSTDQQAEWKNTRGVMDTLGKLGIVTNPTATAPQPEGGRKRRKSRRNAKKTKKAMRKGKKSYSRRR